MQRRPRKDSEVTGALKGERPVATARDCEARNDGRCARDRRRDAQLDQTRGTGLLQT